MTLDEKLSNQQSNYKSSSEGHKLKGQFLGGASQRSPKLIGFILWEPWTSVETFSLDQSGTLTDIAFLRATHG